jgi:alkanesulfonate monooxygenase SsuD/methylene tetrahydromethanopterin reductase-like flavin-dependent oxidoreductase (luciferase family)
MRVGVSLFFAHQGAWAAWEDPSSGGPAPTPDWEFFEEEISLGELVEPLGFDSIWSVEHHFSPISMTPNPLQFLTFFAGRTSAVEFGSMVTVLPWHDPVRLAEEISTLDNLLRGRGLTLGVGRGAAQREFDGFRVPMGESRSRFAESLEIIRGTLSNERFSYEGQHFSFDDLSVRPQLRNPAVLDSMLCAWASPATLEIAANAGLGMLFVNAKPWEEYQKDVVQFNALREQRGWEPTRPTVVVFVSCATTEEKAWEAMRLHAYEQNVMVRGHYEFDDDAHFRQAKGYEFYEQIAKTYQKVSLEEFSDYFARAQVWGTPEQCLEGMRRIRDATSADRFVTVFRYGGMPLPVAEESMRLFASEVLPEIHSWEPSPLLTSTDVVG